MKNKINQLFAAAVLMAAAFTASPMKAQVTIGALTAPKTTLEVVKLPAGSKTPDGILAPRLTLTELNARKSLYTADQVGAMVYITDASGATDPGYSDHVTCIGLIFWSGGNWISSCAEPKTYAAITGQPKAFTFYEQGTETAVPLVFGAGGSSTMTYQWYKIVGSNINVRVSAPCVASDGTGFDSYSFTPAVIKGTTNDARNTGFYKYYCVAKNVTNDSVVSNLCEVAVGCGAKDLNGQWVSFMCFNLGATPQPIATQKSTSFTTIPNSGVANAYLRSANERTLYGDLFQWGRIADGHENRNSIPEGGTGGVNTDDNCMAWNTTTPPAYENGAVLGTGGQNYPWQQVTRGTAYYGKFIKTTVDNNYNWYVGAQTISDQLWRESAFDPNDPCRHIMADGTAYSTFYPAASASTAGGSSGTGWRIPNQAEWASLYRGGNTSGSPAIAYANTWSWYQYSSSATEGAKGYELKPDGATTTLFLPANGSRSRVNALLNSSGVYGNFWSGSISGMDAYGLTFINGSVDPSSLISRGVGFALRCIKN